MSFSDWICRADVSKIEEGGVRVLMALIAGGAFLAAGFWFASATVKMPGNIMVAFGGSGRSVQELN